MDNQKKTGDKKAYYKEYYQRPEVKARIKERRQRPEYKEYVNSYARKKYREDKEWKQEMMQTERGRELLEVIRQAEKERHHDYYVRNQERIKKDNLARYHRNKNKNKQQ